MVSKDCPQQCAEQIAFCLLDEDDMFVSCCLGQWASCGSPDMCQWSTAAFVGNAHIRRVFWKQAGQIEGGPCSALTAHTDIKSKMQDRVIPSGADHVGNLKFAVWKCKHLTVPLRALSVGRFLVAVSQALDWT